MKGDFSRTTFRRARRYTSVRMQQGRVQLDSDWNEQVDIQAQGDQETRRDLLGRWGTPCEEGQSAETSGFALFVDTHGKPSIRKGRYYANGLLCENEGDVALDAQRD